MFYRVLKEERMMDNLRTPDFNKKMDMCDLKTCMYLHFVKCVSLFDPHMYHEREFGYHSYHLRPSTKEGDYESIGAHVPSEYTNSKGKLCEQRKYLENINVSKTVSVKGVEEASLNKNMSRRESKNKNLKGS